MRCIFCKLDSRGAKSIEHIVPESIGNKNRILPRGIICDGCNNYFARKVEGPLLADVSFRNLRAWYQVPTKRGVMPRLYGFVAGTDIDIGLRLGANDEPDLLVERKSNEYKFDQITNSQPETLILFPREFRPPLRMMSRFLAKVGLEALAHRFSRDEMLIRMLIDEPHYDRIRNWARRGECSHLWPINSRQIYPEETLMRHPQTGDWVQAGFGYDLILTKRRETYFVFSLYGYEFAINVGGPSIEGYEEWLEDNAMISPLIERVGLNLERKRENGTEKFYLVGDSDLATGQAFDAAQVKRGMR